MPFADNIIDAVGSKIDLALHGAIGSFADDMIAAERFVFSEETHEALSRLAASKRSTIMSALPLCRLPFKRCWFEWKPRTSSHWQRRPPGKGEFVPSWFGVMLEALDESSQRIGISFAWEHGKAVHSGGVDKPITINPIGYIVDWTNSPWKFITESRNFKVEGVEHLSWDERKAAESWFSTILPVVPPAMQPIMAALREKSGESTAQAALQQGMRDAQGELEMVFAALCLLNSRNCLSVTPVDRSGINKMRRRAGKKPKLSYSDVEIKLSQPDQRFAERLGMSASEIRRHIVRGHFKIRKSGVYWWRPFIRGDASAGEVKRGKYEVA